VTTGGDADTVDGWWRSLGELALRFADAAAAAGRQPDRHLSLDASPRYSLSSVDSFSDAVGRAAELGFTDVVTHWPRAAGWYAGSESVLEAIAADVLPGL
jgi:hypothetical protein